jgi:hypothetical protein
MKIVIRVCTPTPAHREWGDTPFGERLAFAFREHGHVPVLQTRSEWGSVPVDTMLVVALVGQEVHEPVSGVCNIAWIISHPEVRTPAELSAHDAVFVASEVFARRIEPTIPVPVYYLPQCTDPAMFRGTGEYNEDIDLLFVGNNYYDNLPLRVLVSDVVKAGYTDRLKVVGQGWEKGLPTSCIMGWYVAYEQLPALYRRARINLNDHHELMRRHGFVNNRAYDLAHLGCFQIANPMEGLQRLGITTYHSPDELRETIAYYLEKPELRHRSALITQRLSADATFPNRAARILSFVSERFGLR